MLVIVMGVCGCGKTTIGENIAKQLQWSFSDGDQYHPQANVDKMSKGIPLTDQDRYSWLQTIHEVAVKWVANQQNGVITCSALKRKYRNALRSGSETFSDVSKPGDVLFVYLKGDPEVIVERMKHREHFMPPDLVPSQFHDLEEPANDELHVKINIERLPSEIVTEAVDFIRKHNVLKV